MLVLYVRRCNVPKVEVKPRQKYPWDRWLARKTPVVLVKGRDFDGLARSFVVHARSVARDRGLRLSVNVVEHGNKIIFKVAGKSVR